MIHVSTMAGSGLFQIYAPQPGGYNSVLTSAWIKVIGGTVGVGIGSGNDGSTVVEVFSTSSNWTFLSTLNHGPNNTPANEMIIYSLNGPSEFYADLASVEPQNLPEPATAGTLAGGIALYALARLVSKRKPVVIYFSSK
jgi:hypothetical protein